MSRPRIKGTASQQTAHTSATTPKSTAATSNQDRIADLTLSGTSLDETPVLDAFGEAAGLGPLGPALRLAVAPPDDNEGAAKPWTEVVKGAALAERAQLHADIAYWIDPCWDHASVQPATVRGAVDPLTDLAQHQTLQAMLSDIDHLKNAAPQQLVRIRQGQQGVLPSWLARLGPLDTLTLLSEICVDPGMERSWLALGEVDDTQESNAQGGRNRAVVSCTGEGARRECVSFGGSPAGRAGPAWPEHPSTYILAA